ncbi:hypothetical protein H0H81_008935 [Sphagnurus paluster]|uniref:Skg3/CAF120-like PH-like domain-containing protein n=1 Tax=Sphagnurus paluster TaxID=117069 RepID=A0A9P7GJW4_9AGAR|nr:hypothetical protein H0H81_008935 [Sphagnurus paluster]
MQKSASVQNLPQSLTSGHHGGAYLAQTLPNTRSQQNQFQFPTTELGSMAPISSQTPEQRPNHGHSRSTSFFSFRSKQSLSNQQNAHQRTTSLGAANGVVPGAAYSSPPAQYQGQPPPAQYHQAQQSMSGSTSAKSPLARPASLSGNMQSEPQPQPQPQVPAAPPPLHPEIRSVVQLTAAHAHKIYFSGPLVRRIERQADGQRPVKDEGWCDVWAQLGGTTLSIWDMAQIQEASKQGKEVPPTYVNTTDAFVQVLGSVTTPATATGPSKKYANVLTLNTAGSNLLLFSCPSAPALISWAAALRLSAWEKSRLEEIYTAHLIRITLNAPNAPSTLVRGRMEGWVRIRVAGQTDWKRMWMAVVAGEGGPHDRSGGAAGAGNPQALAAPPPKKKRMSNLFSRDNSSPHQSAAPMKPIVLMYASPKPKDKKKPLLTLKDVTQAFAVYPERPELISRSTLIKAEGTFGDEETAAGMKSREGWLLIMPELEGGLGQAAEMLKWVVALHDAFELYGRPDAWTWDPRDPISLMFAYPVGPSKDLLFLDRDLAETLDPRDEHTSSIRSRLIGIVLDRMRGHEPPPQATRVVSQPPTLPPIGSDNVQSTPQHRAPSDPAPQASSSLGPQLPPLSFSETASLEPQQNSEPITERNSTYTNGRVGSGDNSLIQPKPTHNNQYLGQDKSLPDVQEAVLDRPLNTSPGPVSPLQPLQFESVHNTESNTKLPSVENVVASTAPGRRSFDPPNGSFKAPLVSNASSVSNGEFTEGTINPADISLPLSPRESHRAFSPPQSQSPSPSPYTSVPTAVSSSSPPSAYSAGPPLTTVPRRSFSVLSSPYSALGHEEDAQQPAFDQASVLTSPHSPIDFPVTLKSPFSPHGTIRSVDGRNHRAPSSPTLETAPSTSINAMHSISEQSNLFDEAGALYYMQQHLDPSNGDVQNHRRLPTAISEEHDEDEDTSSSSSNHNSSRHRQDEAASPTSNETPSSMKAPVRQNTPMVFVERTSSAISHGDRVSPSRQGLGRKPSGARAQAKASSTRSHFDNAEGISSQQVTEEEETQSEDQSDHHPAQMNQAQTHPSMSSEDPDLDALAALSYLDVEDKPVTPKTVSIEPLNIIKAPSPPPASEAPAQFKSSFAPSKHAAERKAKAQAHQAAHHAATHKPGRANGKRKSKIAGAWNESSDEEEEEDDDDDDEDADSDAEPSAGNKQGSGLSSSNASFHQPQQNVPTHGEHHMESQQQQYSHIRPARTLPQIPANQNYRE